MLRIYHQNICGLGSKTNDLVISFYPTFPHILCLTEHHLRQFQIQHLTRDDYILGAELSRQSFHKRGLYVYIKHFPFSVINIENFYKDKELEACALKLDLYLSKFSLLLFIDHQLVIFSIL